MKTKRIGALDGWRGVAILLVLADHAGEVSTVPWIHKVTRTGATGVGIFFALSGFLITTLLLIERENQGQIRMGAFYIRRLFRIIPSVLFYLVVLLCLRELHILAVTRLQLASSLLLFRNYIHSNWGSGWYTDHFWSLMVEEHFYLVWPILLVVSRGNLKALTAFALAVAGWRAISLHFHLLAGLWAPGRTDLRIDSLLWGCILAIVLAQPDLRERLKRVLKGWVMLLLVAVDIFSNLLHGSHDYSAYEPLILALLVVWPILYPAGVLRRFLDLAPLRFVGTVSYSLYIWQQLWMPFPGAPAPFHSLQAFPFNIVIAFGCGVVCYFTIEKPFIRLGRGLISGMAERNLKPTSTSEAPYAFARPYSYSSDSK